MEKIKKYIRLKGNDGCDEFWLSVGGYIEPDH